MARAADCCSPVYDCNAKWGCQLHVLREKEKEQVQDKNTAASCGVRRAILPTSLHLGAQSMWSTCCGIYPTRLPAGWMGNRVSAIVRCPGFPRSGRDSILVPHTDRERDCDCVSVCACACARLHGLLQRLFVQHACSERSSQS
jgi:hypothetical protein